MTYRQLFKCNNCAKTTAVRVQIGYREVESIDFSCHECQQRITADLKLDQDNGRVLGYANTRGGILVDGFEGDFVVNYSPDFAQQRGRENQDAAFAFLEAFGREDNPVAFLERTGRQQAFVETAAEHASEIERIIRNYQSGQWEHFEPAIEMYFPKGTDLSSPLVRNTAVTFAMEHYLFPLIGSNDHIATIKEINAWIADIAQKREAEFIAFLEEAAGRGYLRQTRSDGLELYLRIFTIADDLRPVLVEWDYEDPDRVDIPHLRVTGRVRFDIVKALFVDAYEFLSRILTLVSALENIEARGNHNAYAAHPRLRNGFNVASMVDFHGKSNAPKGEMLGSRVGRKIAAALDPKLRNGIGHYSASLDEATGNITYPAGAGTLSLDYGSFLLRILRLAMRIQESNHLTKFLYA